MTSLQAPLSSTTRSPLRRWQVVALEVAAVTLITGAAALLRTYQLASAPPGLYHDEAMNGILALHILDGNRSFFFGEREGLYMYLLAAGIEVFGRSEETLRLVSAIIGTFTVPLLYLLARVMFGRATALFAAVGLATSYWHLTLSRDVFRTLTLPLLSTVAVLLFWAALKERRAVPKVALAALAGAALGGVTYTYIAGRVVPLLMLALLVWAVLRDRRALAPLWATIPAYIVAAALIFAPLGAFYLANPTVFFGRMGEVAVASESDAGLAYYLSNLAKTVGMFFVAGDQNWRHNLAGRPALDVWLMVPFAVGAVLALRRWRHTEYLFVLVWLSAMLAPTVAAIEAPHYIRASGALPPMYLLAGAGCSWLLSRAQALLAERGVGWTRGVLAGPTLSALAAVLMLLATGFNTATAYFGEWAQRPETYAAFNGNLTNAGRYLASSPAWRDVPASERSFFVTRNLWRDRTTMLYLLWPWLTTEERIELDTTRLGSRWLEEESALPLRRDGARYLLSSDTSWAATTLRAVFGEEAVTTEYLPGPPGGEPQVVLTAPASELPQYDGPPLASFGGVLNLRRVWLPSGTASGGMAEIVTEWELREAPPPWQRAQTPVTVFVHVVDRDGSLLASAEGLGYEPVDWRDGDRLIQRHTVELPVGTVPGGYEVLLGVLGPDGRRVEETVAHSPDATHRAGEPLTVVPQTAPDREPALDAVVDWRLAEQVALLGVELPAGKEVSPGESLPLRLYWRALTSAPTDLSVTLALAAADGAEAALLEAPLGGAAYPAERWSSGEVVRDLWSLPVSARAPGGTYDLVARVEAPDGSVFGPTTVAQVTVRAIARAFDPPPSMSRLEHRSVFGDLAELLGYELEATPDRVNVRLFWRSLAESDERYKVFVHLVDTEGQIVGQSDAEPAQGGRPLTGWVSGEVVTDAHTIDLPPNLPAGSYQLIVGLYGLDDGTRLTLAGGAPGQTSVTLPALSLGN